MSSDSVQSSEVFCLWLTTEIYVPLDREGYVNGDIPCLEGSMGYVIQAFNREDPSVRYAWKIPRLLGDSLTENQYVCQLLTTEALHAVRMQNSPAILAGLGPAGNPFERPLPGLFPHMAPPSRGIVARHYLLVKFGKGKRPRFCTVTFEGDALTVHPRPSHLQIDRRPSLGVELRKAFEERVYAQYVHEVRDGAPSNVHIAALVDVSDSEQTKGGWYLKLPSVLYNWAGGTLQEAISEGSRTNWTPRENLVLVQQILIGVRELHKKKLLHGDMRPANIMYVRDPTDPEDYVLTDYGSLATGDADRFGSGEALSGERTLFQAITNPRSSQFYAPERRHGYEHEEGDVVLLAPVLEGGLKSTSCSLSSRDLKGWLLVVGWRNVIDVLKVSPSSEAPPRALSLREDAAPVSTRRPGKAPPVPTTKLGDDRSSIEEDVTRVEFDKSALGFLLRSLAELYASPSNSSDSVRTVEKEMRLHPGDRVRFREYVFRVRNIQERDVHAKIAGGKGKTLSTKLIVMYCDPEFWKVFTERLIIVVTDPAKEFPFKGRYYEELSFPKMVELYRWSQATDIFAVGALTLYSLFPRNARLTAREVEQEFSGLLEILENPAFFRKIWPDLDSTCLKLEKSLVEEREHRRAPGEFAIREVQVPRVSRGTLAGTVQPHEPKTIKNLVKDTASSLAQTAPHAYDLFRETFAGNAAHFCMVMRFVLACLHRRTSCSPDWDPEVGTPYCANRVESVSEQIAADKALVDLRKLMVFLTDERLATLALSNHECARIPRFVEQGQAEAIEQNWNLTQELNEERHAREGWQEKVRNLQRRLDDLESSSAVDLNLCRGQVTHLTDNARKTVEILRTTLGTLRIASQQKGDGFFAAKQQAQEVATVLSKVSEELDAEVSRLGSLIQRASK